MLEQESGSSNGAPSSRRSSRCSCPRIATGAGSTPTCKSSPPRPWRSPTSGTSRHPAAPHGRQRAAGQGARRWLGRGRAPETIAAVRVYPTLVRMGDSGRKIGWGGNSEPRGEADQFSHGPGPHLLHQCARCSLTVTSLVPNSAGDLLVEQPGHNPPQHVPLARGQGAVPPAGDVAGARENDDLSGGKHLHRGPTELMSLRRLSRTAASSSTTKTSGRTRRHRIPGRAK